VRRSFFLAGDAEMLVRVLKAYVPRVGKKGQTAEIPDKAARVLILIGSVEQVQEEAKPEPKRSYIRRDMQAETSETKPRKRKAA
jgi:hypothetical protein